MIRIAVNKIKCNRGASIVLALFLILICGFASAAALTSASSNIGRYAYLREYNQQYLAISSAAQMLKEQFEYLNGRICMESNLDSDSYSIDNFKSAFDASTFKFSKDMVDPDSSLNWDTAFYIDWKADSLPSGSLLDGSIIKCTWQKSMRYLYASAIYNHIDEDQRPHDNPYVPEKAELTVSGDWCTDNTDGKYNVNVEIEYPKELVSDAGTMKIKLTCGDYAIEFTVDIKAFCYDTPEDKKRIMLNYDCGTITLPGRAA